MMRICAFTLALLASCGVGVGTPFKPLSIDQLQSKADLVLKGKVIGKTTQRDHRGGIYTEIDLHVSEVWKGEPETDRVTIVQGGGTLGTRRQVVTGQAEYRINEELVAFLVLNSRGEAVTLGLAQGKFNLWQRDEGGPQYAHNGLLGLPGSRGRTDLRARLQGERDGRPSSNSLLTVSELRRQIEAASR